MSLSITMYFPGRGKSHVTYDMKMSASDQTSTPGCIQVPLDLGRTLIASANELLMLPLALALRSCRCGRSRAAANAGVSAVAAVAASCLSRNSQPLASDLDMASNCFFLEVNLIAILPLFQRIAAPSKHLRYVVDFHLHKQSIHKKVTRKN